MIQLFLCRGNNLAKSKVLTEEELKQLFEEQAASRDELVNQLEEQVDKELDNPAKTTFYNPFIPNESSLQEAVLDLQNRYQEVISTDDGTLPGLSLVSAEPETDIVNTEVADSVVSSMNSQVEEPSIWELSDWWLKAAQTLLLTRYIQSNSYTAQEEDALLDLLAILQTDLNQHDRFSLASVLTTLVETSSSDIASTYTIDTDLPLTAQLSSLLLQMTKDMKYTSKWMQECLKTYVAAKSSEDTLQIMYSEAFCKNWTGYNWLELFNACSQHLDTDTHMHVLHKIQTYGVKPSTVMSALNKNPQTVISKMPSTITQQDIGLPDFMDEISATNLIEEALIAHVKNIVERLMITEILFGNVKEHYEAIIEDTNRVVEAKPRFRLLTDSTSSVNDDEIAVAIHAMLAVCQKIKGWSLRLAQIVSLVILLLSSREKSNILLEVITGEGKSAIIAIFATILAFQDKHVDVVTSSPILAVRDVEEWREYYEFFEVTVSHNTDLNRPEDADLDEEKRESYKKQVVYGTVGNFACDILRKEFDHENVRGDRPLDVALVDEVDMLMLDEGVQFTYLSHDGSILRHIESVIAAVWSIVGPLNVTRSSTGKLYYAGHPKLFTQAVYECLDPELSQIDSQTQILGVARDLGIITQSQFEVLDGDNQEAKKPIIEGLTIANALSLVTGLGDYENMPEFHAFIASSDGALEPVTEVTDEDSAEALLLLDKGLACILNTQEQIIERGAAIIQSKLIYSGAISEGTINVPKQMKEYIVSQLPVYVKSAIRALHMEQDREYTISNGRIVPVDFQNSGVIELNKKWGGGLQ